MSEGCDVFSPKIAYLATAEEEYLYSFNTPNRGIIPHESDE